jgi:hypothetical protein
MSSPASALDELAQQQQARLIEVRRRLSVRDRIDEQRRLAQREAQRERLEMITRFPTDQKGELKMTAANRPGILSHRLPLSGNTALSASALMQAVLGVEFVLSSLNKFADRTYVGDFAAFVRATPGAMTGILAPLVQRLVLANTTIFARLIETTELLVGVVLLLGAVEIGRRRFGGRIGAQHRYETGIALVSAAAGLAGAALTLSIALLMGEGLPTIAPGRAFDSAIPIELFIVPLGIAVAWIEFGRFLALRRGESRPTSPRTRFANQPKAA